MSFFCDFLIDWKLHLKDRIEGLFFFLLVESDSICTDSMLKNSTQILEPLDLFFPPTVFRYFFFSEGEP